MGIWTKALRSGDYKQTRGEILYDSRTDTYCCMGVLDDIKYGRKTIDNIDENKGYPCDFVLGAEDLNLYVEEDERTRIESENYSFSTAEKRYHVLAYLNDVEGWNFEEIADLIDELGWENA